MVAWFGARAQLALWFRRSFSIVAAPGRLDRGHEHTATSDHESMSPGCHEGRIGLITPNL
jgi:hypothetical protein